MSIRLIKLLTPVLQPAYRKYFSRIRTFRYKSVSIRVYPDVFYPGFVFSTKILLRYIEKLDLSGKTFLELGAGSGIISLFAAQKGAIVTATDINPSAISNIVENARLNNKKIKVFQSDLFENIPETTFNYIIISPPYYPSDPETYAEMAWYCGKNFEYFENLFHQLPRFCNESSSVLMILSEDCDIPEIKERGARYGFNFFMVHKKRKMGEWNFIFKLQLVDKI
jgi:release factor glutamine methyltransferase